MPSSTPQSTGPVGCFALALVIFFMSVVATLGVRLTLHVLGL